MAKRRNFARSEIHNEMPEPEHYSVRCKLCWGGPGAPLSESIIGVPGKGGPVSCITVHAPC